MADSGRRFAYFVCGFGSHVEGRLVEFLCELNAECVCFWCGRVVGGGMTLAFCGDIVCQKCYTCLIHPKKIYKAMELPYHHDADVGNKKVRCVNARRGCQFEGVLYGLDTHLKMSCAFQFIACVRCWRAVPCKDMRTHFSVCKSASQTTSSSSAAKSLLEDLAIARKELERALALKCTDGEHCKLRKAVTSASEVLARLQTQLAMACCSLPDGTLALGAL
ncbi:hypothetical protein HPB51_008139 [Rhipicephalus microplus]|uniref:Uncharacterized protein n=2 Tax=Rhipicephalus microplus TaxID=6941 RepID=A0A9J6E8H9_RHIMP|nr:hypothetical protein HPB51_008139 [Rhipicephalus microplus]